ncbi:MAG: hypothetical protein ABSH56_00035 [Bryobacteraceae bacterium]
MALFALHAETRGLSAITILNFDSGLVPYSAPAAVLSPARATGTVSLALVMPQGAAVSPGDTFQVRLLLDAASTPVNAVDAVISYPSSSMRLIARDESVSPFTMRLGNTPDVLSEVIEVQPNPGVRGVAPLAQFTFEALRPGMATIAIASSSEVLANDGFGTEVLGSVQDASVSIQ